MRSRDKTISRSVGPISPDSAFHDVRGHRCRRRGQRPSTTEDRVERATTPDTLARRTGGTNHGDPDDFDFVPPIGIWIQALLMAVGH